VQQVLGTEKACCLSNSTCDTFYCISELLRLEMSHLLSDFAILHLQSRLIDLLLLGLPAARVSQLRHLLIHRLLSLALLSLMRGLTQGKSLAQEKFLCHSSDVYKNTGCL
jgi:hypothetical protein